MKHDTLPIRTLPRHFEQSGYRNTTRIRGAVCPMYSEGRLRRFVRLAVTGGFRAMIGEN